MAKSGSDDKTGNCQADSNNIIGLEDVPLGDYDDRNDNDHDASANTNLLKNSPSPIQWRNSKGIIPTPMKDAWCFSKYVSFWWMNSLLALGNKRPLEDSDLYGLLPEDSTEVLAHSLFNAWDVEIKRYKQEKRRPSLVRALINAFGKGYAALGLFPLFADGLGILQPILLGSLVTYFVEDSPITKKEAYLYAAGVGLCGLFILLFNVPFAFMKNVYGMRVRAACTALIYKKVLHLSRTALASTTTGNLINLVSADAQKFDWTAPFLHYLILGPLEVGVVAVLLWYQIGPAALAGVGLLVCLAPMQVKMGNALMSLRSKAIHWMDERVKIMNEIIAGMRVIKMYTWEDSFAKLIMHLRKNELKWFLRMAYIQGAFASFFFSSAGLIYFTTFLVYVLTGEVLTAAKVFTCVSLFNSVRIVCALFFPFAITLFNESRVSLKRFEEALLLDEMHSEGLVKSTLRPKAEECGVFVKKASATWNKEIAIPTLDGLSFDVPSGCLLGVIGAVGSGKSSLLNAILGELPLSEGSIRVQGRVAYASQQAWVYNSTLRHNILFGKEYDEHRYNDVIKACTLDKDFELLSEGDETLVGERGVSLSGGQRARISLARAVYADGDIYLLDDPLSAVDANVGRHLFQECICTYLKDKARILVTHQLQFLKDADEIMVLQQGQCIDKGTYQQLSRNDSGFLSLLAEEVEEETGNESDGDDGSTRFGRPVSKQLSVEEVVRKRAGNVVDSCMSIMSAATTLTVYENKLPPEETKQEGAVSRQTYAAYLRSFHDLGTGVFLIFLFAMCQVMLMFGDVWLANWANREEVYSMTLASWNASSNTTSPSRPDLHYYLSVYAALVFGLFVLCLICTMSYYWFTIVASRNLHNGMFHSLIHTNMHFFDNNSIGRILNRFSKDIGVIDDFMPWMLCDVLQIGFSCLGIMCLVAASNPVSIAIVLPVICLFFYFRNYFMKSSREMKRIEGINRSPLFGHFSTTLLGIDTIRAYGVEATFTDQFNSFHDAHSRAWYAYLAGQSWLTCRLQALGVVFLLFIVLGLPALKDALGLSAGTVGLILSYSIMLAKLFEPFVEESAEVENIMTSVERVVEYTSLPPEGEKVTDVIPPPDWPDKGKITFDNMSFSYHQSLPEVLHNVTCVIKPSEKVGVVGRTGAGKSSLLSTLFRLAEPKGLIDIDGINIRKLGLKDLRSKLSIIPQDPVLFSGTMRKNLDPFSEHPDSGLWKVLDEVQLKQPVEDLPGKLDEELAEAGSNFSVGQRQLVCLARAILRHSRILVIDEATANVDPRTDALIQETIRDKFQDCTVLTIAHRLHTIMDSDRVMVLDAGRLVEFDAPYKLLKKRNTIFSGLVEQTGGTEAKRLFDIAQQTFYKQMEALKEESEGRSSDDEAKVKSEDSKESNDVECEDSKESNDVECKDSKESNDDVECEDSEKGRGDSEESYNAQGGFFTQTSDGKHDSKQRGVCNEDSNKDNVDTYSKKIGCGVDNSKKIDDSEKGEAKEDDGVPADEAVPQQGQVSEECYKGVVDDDDDDDDDDNDDDDENDVRKTLLGSETADENRGESVYSFHDADDEIGDVDDARDVLIKSGHKLSQPGKMDDANI
ncbi:ATP-binding cassette sub-family C member 4 isoform X2 [Nematostella vectensis]|uniref:ATP-binding cassette sub-family C member 4 isoform X2 n=1 Tax=Nematostella vectensis TaxID=45351 RepID=UPI0020771F0B|nr:ATP-binding cassette sub-family C member 4 isoform X2 [Nematostella vectensis]